LLVTHFPCFSHLFSLSVSQCPTLRGAHASRWKTWRCCKIGKLWTNLRQCGLTGPCSVLTATCICTKCP
jgi:hypothetical protein